MGQQPTMEQIELENAITDTIKVLEQSYREAQWTLGDVLSKERRAYWEGVCETYRYAIEKVQDILER